MFKESDPTLYWRSLLTETLPYEVPVIFSNELLYASLVKPSDNALVTKIVDCLRGRLNKYTIPYDYQISKDDTRHTTLGIIHPNHQIEIANFYELYKQSLIDYCSGSEATLRRPVADMALFSEATISDDAALKQGIPHIRPEDGEIDVSRMTSYFTYGRYNLLGKFIDSHEFRDLEKKFRLLRSLDVSKCFFHIYTHSITWAIKGKKYSKAQSDTYSFEARFDRLMQKANYNETNGIVIGPEVSRIFAEIIFQEIDREIIESVLPHQHNMDYSIRRYVDDYFVFSSTDLILEKVTGAIEAQLQRFKLFINADKTTTVTRPFVSSITLARSELSNLISQMDTCLDSIAGEIDAAKVRRQAKQLGRLALDIRLISERYNVSFNSLSGWLLGTLRGLLRRSVGSIKAADDENKAQAATQMAMAILNIATYVAALDTRVRTTYTLCQIAITIDQLKADQTDAFDQLSHSLKDELESLISALMRLREARPSKETIELYNLLIAGAQFFGPDFFEGDGPKVALYSLLAISEPTYFSYITVKFCLLKDRSKYQTQLNQLNSRVRAKLDANLSEIGTVTELYLMACDYLSAPDVSVGDKRSLVESLCGGQPANAVVQEAGKYLGFVDWDGIRIVHALARRELRPVYSWS